MTKDSTEISGVSGYLPSLNFLRKTPWARTEIKTLYRDSACDNSSLME